MRQRAIPYMQLWGCGSKALHHAASNLPADAALGHRMVIAAMGGVGRGDSRQIGGPGGAD